ncbi:MAG: RHS repeat protein, partial [Snodgrassella sp.]|uniref:RHS repeat domain-containing protein n=1 Tax=Snodgrassella sp. TaxID=2815304 RepID=UPI00338EA804|nr:RHS repeat protein [Snodgrassella sp.]
MPLANYRTIPTLSATAPLPARSERTGAYLDAIGRLIGKYTADGTTAYQYDQADNLIKVGYKKAGLPAEAEPDL